MRVPQIITHRAVALQDYLRAANERAFAWGDSDCVTFASGWLAAIRPDLAIAEFERSNALQAARHIRGQLGGLGCAGGLGDAVSSVLGQSIAPLLAQVGDLVLLPTLREKARLAQGRPAGRLGYTLGICAGGAIAAPAQQGLIYTPCAAREPGRLEYLSAGVAAWRV